MFGVNDIFHYRTSHFKATLSQAFLSFFIVTPEFDSNDMARLATENFINIFQVVNVIYSI